MTPLNFAIVGLRLFAIYFFIESVPLLAEAGLMGANAMAGIPQPAGYVFILIPACLFLFLGCLFYFLAEPLARRLAPPVADESKKVACSFEDLQAIVFAAVGLLIVSNALPGAGRALEYLFYLFRAQQEGGANDSRQVSYSLMSSLGVFAQIVIGLLLLLNPPGFRKIWRWLRTAGTPPVE